MNKTWVKYGLRILVAAALAAGIYSSFKPLKFKYDELKEQSEAGKYNFVTPEDFEKHYGEFVIFDGEITKASAGKKLVIFKFYKNFQTKLTLVLFEKYYDIFPDLPEKYYLNQKVRVTGFLEKYKNKPEIILYNPKQVEIRESP
ncbi:MAG: hypothetical protein A2452_08840 [Candidatus Firestonebacteria bacterium RIFOXYC2_FULL_39_67]|nr:MAG: hypothetical protein A2536_09660 [Candidatus Firestonebacteria bacterium RIFOXYD2_FULL_39_29]OGF53560.1 MAG: hypothetical protein A2452_08840 [Candidatus Firestonebacteria bacterium RIFOXYC2_FULL_39_67]